MDKLQYLHETPTSVPAGKLLCHGPVVAVDVNQRQGENGFRIFTVDESDSHDMVRCGCGWEPDLVHHSSESAWARRGMEVPTGGVLGIDEDHRTGFGW
jgi:hypothetical protein